MVDSSEQWVCIHIANSFPEADLLRSLLQMRGIQVCICQAPTSQLHDYLHDPNEKVRLFIPAADQAQGRHYTETFLKTQQLSPLPKTPCKNTP